ncbi:MAG TPA: outer membrane lipoprotein carrier protein LolA [Candidimonas sp.]|nr:outer membrane lipoprotein carrier protein LolA [Candidimonas sp.]
MPARRMIRYIFSLLLCIASPLAWSFSLADLQTQLQSTPVVRGGFVQQKFLRSLAQPLTSRGSFTLAPGRGLLWRVRSPLVQDLRITAQGIARLDDQGRWQPVPQHSGGSRESRLFLSVLAGDTEGLQQHFTMTLAGQPDDWELTLTPRAALLQQVFQRIRISGGKLVHRIELFETQGDRGVMSMTDTHAASQLLQDEEHAFAD